MDSGINLEYPNPLSDWYVSTECPSTCDPVNLLVLTSFPVSLGAVAPFNYSAGDRGRGRLKVQRPLSVRPMVLIYQSERGPGVIINLTTHCRGPIILIRPSCPSIKWDM